MNIVGIDYSMTSPSICIHCGNEWSLSNCKFYFLTTKKKSVISSNIFQGDLQPIFTNQEERFNFISNWAISLIPKNSIIFLEGYSYSSKGVVFDIGENTGVLKHKIWISGNSINCVSPSSIKKYASGKGNANKLLMYESFIEDTNFDISASIHCREGQSPMSDIIDSYYIAKFGFNQITLK